MSRVSSFALVFYHIICDSSERLFQHYEEGGDEQGEYTYCIPTILFKDPQIKMQGRARDFWEGLKCVQ